MLRSSARAVLGALFFVATATSTFAQGAQGTVSTPQAPSLQVQAAPPALLAQFDVMVGTVQTLQVPIGTPTTASIDVQLAGAIVHLDLVQHDLRTAGFQLIERSAFGETVLPTPACVTYRGAVRGDGGSEVAASLRGGSLTAWIRLGSGDLWMVQAVREVQPTAGAAAHVVYHSTDSRNSTATCGVPGIVQGHVPSVVEEDVVYACQLAIEADFPYFQANGSSVTATQNDITSVVNAMDVIYRRDVQITLQVTTVIVNSTTDPYTSNVAGTLLNQFGNNWNATRGAVVRDVAHMFTGRPMGQSSGGAVGIAFVGVVCNLGSAYGVSQSRFTGNWAHRVAVTAHEIGHNFNAGHCDAVPPCNIMCSGVGGCGNNPSSFGAGESAQIIGYRQGANCLAVQQTTPVINLATPLTVKTWRPVFVTLTGSGFTGVTTVTVGGTPVTTGITVQSDTQLRFTPPAGLPLGVQTLTVTNGAGTSLPFALVYTSANPCEMSVPTGILGGTTLNWQFGGWQNDPAFLVVSLVGTTTPFQGFPLLDGFSVLWLGGLDTRGMGSYGIPVPASILNGVRAYSQLIDFDGATAAVRSTSAVASTLIIF